MNDEYANGAGMGDMQGVHEEGGYCIEIYVGADNQVKGVKVEQKGMQDGAEMEVEAKMPASSIEEALQVAQSIYQSGGKMEAGMMEGAMAARAQEQEDADLDEGYGRGNIRGPGRMPVRKVFSNGDGA